MTLINISLLDATYLLEMLEAVPLLAIAGIVGYRLMKRQPITKQTQKQLWYLFGAFVVCMTTVRILATYNYFHYERPIYRLENQRATQK